MAHQCHAKAVIIDDCEFPACDTLLLGFMHVHSQMQAGVGACKVSSCACNDELQCSAAGIQVGMDEDEAGRMTPMRS